MRPLSLLALGAAAALLVAACSADASDEPTTSADPPAEAPVEMAEEGLAAAESAASDDGDGDGASEGDGGSAGSTAPTVVDETLALDAGPGAPAFDANVPWPFPDSAVGRPGYTRYVFTEVGGEVIPALVEGPRGEQVRCQQVELPCSYTELAALLDSGAEIPPELGLTTAELGDLVGELAEVEAALTRFVDVDAACAAGYRPDQKQTPNMGSHFTNVDLIDTRFVPGEPEILLYARVDGGEPEGALGVCRDGRWEGEDVEIVGAAYFVPRLVAGPDHFSGFTGPLDNWHIHYNLCRLDGRDVTVLPADCGPGTPTGGRDEPQGDASEGWMIHAWASPTFDNQLGVFSMWNPTLWPVAPADTVAGRGSVSGTTDDTNLIVDFQFPEITLTEPGTVRFFNADAEAHTVTAGTPAEPAGSLFDSGVIAGRDANEITVTEPGTYSFFCEIHPTMQGTITVEG